MSKKGVTVVVGRAVVDDNYRELLKDRPLEAMEGYDLNISEKQAIAGMDYNQLEKFASNLNHRLRHWFVAWS